jgi:hypothetical protein
MERIAKGMFAEILVSPSVQNMMLLDTNQKKNMPTLGERFTGHF